MSFWESAFFFFQFYLCPAGFLAVIAAIILLVLRRKKNGVRPPRARGYLIAAICLFIFAALVLMAFLFCLGALVVEFGFTVVFAGLKSV